MKTSNKWLIGASILLAVLTIAFIISARSVLDNHIGRRSATAPTAIEKMIS